MTTKAGVPSPPVGGQESGGSAAAIMEPHTAFHSFACHVPLDVPPAPEEEDENLLRVAPKLAPSLAGLPSDIGVVGTISVLGRTTVMIWLGWGRVVVHEEESKATWPSVSSDPGSGATASSPLKAIEGSASHLLMGPLMVALPRTNYQGAFSEETPSSSKLIPSEDMESELLASPMAARLSQQLQKAVFLSCHFDDTILPEVVGGPMERLLLRRRATALAEQRICQILQEPSDRL